MATLDLAALVQAAEDDSNEAPWMTVPEFQYVVARLLVGILSLHHRRHRLGWHVGGELGVSMPRPEGGTLHPGTGRVCGSGGRNLAHHLGHSP